MPEEEPPVENAVEPANAQEEDAYEAAQDAAEEQQEIPAVKIAESAPQQMQETLPSLERKLDSLRVVEAALFIGNKSMAYAELAIIAKTSVKKAKELVGKLAEEYASRGGAIELVVSAQDASMQVKNEFLSPVAQLSKNVELSRKAMKMLALVAKKGKLLQSELKRYFKGEIYAYVNELKELGYISSEKHGATRLLRITEKFKETFQMQQLEAATG